MQETPDAQLLRDYAEGGDEAAFREIVTRHTDLVYSAALRQVTLADLAQDISQSVFVDLARKAKEVGERLPANASLVGWLYRSTRFAVLNHLRDDRRRATHERQAMEQLITDCGPAQDWERICPLLDEAMAQLSDDDRDAVLLRYFKNHDFRAVGAALGLSDDAAQKRVSRAVERLREFFSKRGVAIGASGLIVVVSANAVQAAPAALVTTISTAALLAGTAVQTSTAIAATKAIVMTTLQKTIVVAALTAAIGTGIYEARQAAQLQNEVQTLQQRQAPLAEEIQQLQRERDDAKNLSDSLATESARLKSNSNELELLKLRGEVAQLRQANAANVESNPNNSRGALMKSWLEREDKLKQIVQEYPDKTIPELQLLSEQQWLNAAMDAKFDQDKDIQQALANLRHTGENNFASLTQPAIEKYMKANGGQFPTDLSQLQPYFKTPVDEAILSRWEILPQSALPNQSMGGDWVITEKTPVDPELDNRWAIGQGGYGNTTYQSADVSAAIATIDPAMKAYVVANNGKEPTDATQILPYLTTPQQQAAYQTLLKRFPTNKLSQ